MMARCYNKNDSRYKYYGAKGVTVSERWHDFWSFVDDVNNHLENGHLLYEKNYQLDKDQKGGNRYSLENCTVISAEKNRKLQYEKQQRKVIAISESEEIKFESVTKTSEVLNIKRTTLIGYLQNGKQHSSGYFFKYCS